MDSCTWTTEGSYITLQGVVDGIGAEKLVSNLDTKQIYTLDFDQVADIKFAGQRSLLRCRQSGQRFCIINAADSVAEKLEDSGVASYINVCRKPKPLQIKKYQEFGASFMSKAYNSEDGDSMIKVYSDHGSLPMVAHEKAMARAVMMFGIPTPLVGTLYSDGNAYGLDFERIVGKRSLARIISEEPERLEEIAREFARMCKQLHNTPCDTAVFPSRSALYREHILSCKAIDDNIRQKMTAYMDTLPETTTCIHGDMQIGNIINNGKENLWIDLGDFSYGNPMLDFGMTYFQMCVLPEDHIQKLYHITKAQAQQVWDILIDEYFKPQSAEETQAIEGQIQKICAIHMTYLVSLGGLFDFMLRFIKEQFA